MTEKEPKSAEDPRPRRVKYDEIYLPIPELGEELTHLACPECDVGEIPLKRESYYQCDSCHEVYYIALHKAPGIKELFKKMDRESEEFIPLEDIDMKNDK